MTGRGKAHDWPGGWKSGYPVKRKARAGTCCRSRKTVATTGMTIQNKTLKSDLQKADGKTTLVETTSAGWGEGRGAAPMQDWQAKRYGIDIPGPNIDLRNAAVMSVLNACQIPLALFSDADGTSQRESWRRFAMGPLAGLARIIESEIADKLMTPVKFDFSGLWAHDIQGRASSFQKLVAGGMSIEQAAGASGVLMDS